MITYYLLYNDQGRILSTGNVSSIEEVELQIQPGLDGQTKFYIISDQPFTVSSDYHKIVNGAIVEYTWPKPYNYTIERASAYANLKDQFDMLYKDIDAGLLGLEAKSSQFYQHIKSVKDQFPKDTV